jgi:hypothetical protein
VTSGPGAAPGADPARRSRLLGLKLAALVREHLGDAPVTPGVFPGGAALRREDEAWVLVEDRPERALGPAMAWARQQGADGVHVLVESSSATLARRAAAFRAPARVWHVEGRAMRPAVAEPLPQADPVEPALLELVADIEAAGAVPAVEHGVLAGEVLGLEVCRAVRDPHTGAVRLEVGVGAHDREAFQLIHGDRPPADALAQVVATVAAHRSPGAAPHPLNRLGAERLLRHRVVADPASVGAAHLAAAPPPVPRTTLKDPVPCVAVGAGADGSPLVVVCSVGVDLDLVPFAADARALHGPARLVLAVPARDRHPVTVALADALLEPATVVGIDPD